MLQMLMVLWSLPLVLGIIALVRCWEGLAPISDSARRRYFGEGEEIRLSVWMAVKFVALAAIFFVAGLVEGAVLLNFSALWIAMAALTTASGAMVLMALWVRFGPAESRVRRRVLVPTVMSYFRTLARPRASEDLSNFSATLKHPKPAPGSTALARRYEEHEF